ncbi:MAG: PP2C family serine/threonine-protein phosphatase [Myxococcota bacterium]
MNEVERDSHPPEERPTPNSIGGPSDDPSGEDGVCGLLNSAASTPAPDSDDMKNVIDLAVDRDDASLNSASEPERSGPAEETTAEEAAAGAHDEATQKEVPQILCRYFGKTDVGLVREHNEDNFLVADLYRSQAGLTDGAEQEAIVCGKGLVLAVCDGMGGAAAGEVASQMAVDTIYEVMECSDPPADRDGFAYRLMHSIEEAGNRIFNAARLDRSRRGMGTTATVAGMVDKVLFIGQVGDSRAYLLRGSTLSLITKDQSLVNQLIEAGQLTEEEAEAFEHSNIILQALGTTEEVSVDLTFLEIRQGDRLVLCSDGLSGLVHADLIKETLQEFASLDAVATRLIELANNGGGHDNITVICAEFQGEGLAAPSDDVPPAYQQYPLPAAAEEGRNSSPAPAGPFSLRTSSADSGQNSDPTGAVFDSNRAPAGIRINGFFGPIGLLFFLVLAFAALVFALALGDASGNLEDANRTPTSTNPEPLKLLPVTRQIETLPPPLEVRSEESDSVHDVELAAPTQKNEAPKERDETARGSRKGYVLDPRRP